MIAVRSLLIAAAALVAAAGCSHGRSAAVPPPANSAASARQIASTVAGAPLYISAGGPAASPYVADEDYSGGTVGGSTTHAIDTSGVTNPAPQSVYQHARVSKNAGKTSFSYVLPKLTAGGAYTVRLHFAEYSFSTVGSRVFNVSINGTEVLSNLDIVGTAGAEYRAYATQPFAATADSSGQITIAFTNVTNRADVQGIELQAAGAPAPAPPGGSDYLTYHGDNARDGWNQNETVLTVANAPSLQVKATLPVDGLVVAQPLYAAGVPVGGGTKNLVIVATENDSVYAFDADSLGTVVWKRTIGTAQSSTSIGCTDITPSYGITGTPVIVRPSPYSSAAGSGTIYVIAATQPSSNTFRTELHALDLTSGADQATTLIAPATWTMSNGTQVSFNDQNQMNRAGVAWANNSLYIAFGSHCDNNQPTTFGWLFRYSGSLQRMSTFVTSEDVTSNYLASIWQAGFQPAFDSSGNVYAVTGNGTYDANTSGRNYGESVLKLPSDLSGVSSYFTPDDYDSLNTGDTDFGSGGVMLIPNTSLAVAMGKASKMFLLNQTNLGGEGSGNPGAVQVLTSNSGGGVWGGPAYFGGPGGPWIYYQTDSDYMRAFSLSGSTLTQSSVGPTQSGYGGSSPIVSSNGSTDGTGLLWSIRRPASSGGSLTLEVYDARNVSKLLKSLPAGNWNNPSGNTNAFISPLVANGKAYAGGSSTVTVVGL